MSLLTLVISLLISLITGAWGYGCGMDGTFTCSADTQSLVVAAGQTLRLADCSYVNCPTIFVRAGGRLVLERVSLSASRPTGTNDTGAVSVDGGSVDATMVRFESAAAQVSAAVMARSATLTLLDVEMAGLVGRVSGGGALSARNSSIVARNLQCHNASTLTGNGGCMRIVDRSTLDCANCTFTGNVAVATRAYAGAVFVGGTGTRAVFRQCRFTANAAEYDAAITADDSSNVRIEACTFERHRGNDSVVGSRFRASVSLSDTVIIDNTVVYGAVYAKLGGNATCSNCSFHANTGTFVAAFYVDYGSAGRIENSRFSANAAPKLNAKGIVLVDLDGSLVLRNVSMEGNVGASAMYAHEDASLSLGGYMRIANNTVNATACSGTGAMLCLRITAAARLSLENVFRASTGSLLAGTVFVPAYAVAKLLAAHLPLADFPLLRLVNGVPVRAEFASPATNATLVSPQPSFPLPTLVIATYDMFGVPAFDDASVRVLLTNVNFTQPPTLAGEVWRHTAVDGTVTLRNLGFQSTGAGTALLSALLSSAAPATDYVPPPNITILVNPALVSPYSLGVIVIFGCF